MAITAFKYFYNNIKNVFRKRGCTYCFIFSLLTCSAHFDVKGYISSTLAKVVHSQFGINISFKNFKANSYKDFELYDVTLYNKDKKKVLAFIDKAEIKWNLLHPSKVTKIVITNARINLDIGAEKNFINFVNDISNDASDNMIPPIEQLLVINSQLTFREISYKRIAEKKLFNVNGEINFNRKEKKMLLKASGINNRENAAINIKTEGDKYDIKLDFKNLNIDNDITQYAQLDDKVSFKSGIADVKLVISNKGISGNINFSDAVASSIFTKSDIRELVGAVKITPNLLTATFKGRRNHNSFDAVINFDMKKIFEMQLNSNNAMTDELIETINLATPKSLIETIKGNAEKTAIFIIADFDRKNNMDKLSILTKLTNVNLYNLKSKFDRLNANINLTFKNGILVDNKVIFSNILADAVGMKILADGECKINSSGYLLNLKSNFNDKNNDFIFNLEQNNYTYNISLQSKKGVSLKNADIETRFKGNTALTVNYKDRLDILKAKIALDIESLKMSIIENLCLKNYKLNAQILNNSIYSNKSDLSFDILSDSNQRSELILKDFGLIANSMDYEAFDFNVNFSKFILKDNNINVANKESSNLASAFNVKAVYKNGQFDAALDSTNPVFEVFGATVMPETLSLGIKGDSLGINIDEQNFCGEFIYNQEKLKFQSNILVKDSIVNIKKLKINNSILFGNIDLKNYSLNLEAEILENDISEKLSGFKFGPFSYGLIGKITFFGSLNSIMMHSKLYITNFILYKKVLPTVGLTFSMKNSQFALSEVEILNNGKSAKLDVDGIFNYETGRCDIDLIVDKIEASEMFNSLSSNLSGNLQLQFFFNHENGESYYNFDLKGSKINYFGLEFSDIDLFLVGDKSQIKIEKANIKYNDSWASLFGSTSTDLKDYDINIKTNSIDLTSLTPLYSNFVTSVSGSTILDLRILNGNVYGNLEVKDISFSKEFERPLFQDFEVETPIIFKNISGKVVFNKNEAILNSVKGIFNNGTLNLEGAITFDGYNIIDKFLIADFNRCEFYVSKLINSMFGGNIEVTNDGITGNINIISGSIINIPTFVLTEDSNISVPDMDIKISIQKDFNVNLKNYFSIDSIDSDIYGELSILFKNNNVKLDGNLFTNNGFLVFNNNKFDISAGELYFKGKPAPYIKLNAVTELLESKVYANLEGDTAAGILKIENPNEVIMFRENIELEIKDELKLRIWSQNPSLSFDELIFLLTGDNKISTELSPGDSKFLTKQVGDRLVFLPLSSKIKNFLGVYQFKIESALFDFENIMKRDLIFNPLSKAVVEMTVNIYKNSIFGNFKFGLPEDNINYLEYLQLSASTRNKFFFGVRLNELGKDNKFFNGFELQVSKKIKVGIFDIMIECSKLEELLKIFTNNIMFSSALQAMSLGFQLGIKL